MNFEELNGYEPLDNTKSSTQETIAARELTEKYAFSPIASNESFMAKSILTLIDSFDMDFIVEGSNTQAEVICYQNKKPISHNELYNITLNPEIENFLNSKSAEERQKSLDHATLTKIYASLLYPLQRNYTLGLRLAIQQDDMLPIIAEQTCVIQDKLQTTNIYPDVSFDVYNNALIEIQQRQANLTDHVRNPYNSNTSPRTKAEIKSIEALDTKTLHILATVKAIGEWVGNVYLNNVSAVAIESIVDDPWKQARIQNSTYWRSFEHIFQDGINGNAGQFNIIADLLTYHCYVNRVKLVSLDDVIKIIADSRFQRTLHTLLGATNGANVDLWDLGYIPADFLDDSGIPEITSAGKAYLKEQLYKQNYNADSHKQEFWNNTNIKDQHQQRCVAAIHLAHLKISTSLLPQPGESTEAYINHLQELKDNHPSIFNITQEGNSFTLTMLKDPIRLLTEIFILALSEYHQQQ